MKITLIPLLQDNYAYLLEGENGDVTVIDPGEANPVIEKLESQNLTLNNILCTHHHHDHIGGIKALKSRYNCQLFAPQKDQERIPAIDTPVRDGDTLNIGGETVQAIETPGHTLNHICYYAPQSKALFSGDTLFSMGCGRLFEGTATQMWNSLQKLCALPDDTLIYCGHEYTLGHAEFCLSLDPDNADLQKRYKEVQSLRAQKKPSLPVTLETEKKTNIFLRAGSEEKFKTLRKTKDNY